VDCLTVLIGLPMLVGAALASLGLALQQPAMAWGFGYLALLGFIPFLWLLLSAPIRKRFGARGERVFNRVLTIGGLVELALPLLIVLIASIPVMESNSSVLVLLLLAFNLLCAGVFAIWWRRTRP
jgi:hypothetical protein